MAEIVTGARFARLLDVARAHRADQCPILLAVESIGETDVDPREAADG